MLQGQPNAAAVARTIADYFADSERHKSHSKAIDRDEARAQGVVISNLEDDQALQDAVLSAYHAFMITFQTPTVKIIENNLGRTFAVQQQVLQMPPQSIPPVPPQSFPPMLPPP